MNENLKQQLESLKTKHSSTTLAEFTTISRKMSEISFDFITYFKTTERLEEVFRTQEGNFHTKLFSFLPSKKKNKKKKKSKKGASHKSKQGFSFRDLMEDHFENVRRKVRKVYLSEIKKVFDYLRDSIFEIDFEEFDGFEEIEENFLELMSLPEDSEVLELRKNVVLSEIKKLNFLKKNFNKKSDYTVPCSIIRNIIGDAIEEGMDEDIEENSQTKPNITKSPKRSILKKSDSCSSKEESENSGKVKKRVKFQDEEDDLKMMDENITALIEEEKEEEKEEKADIYDFLNEEEEEYDDYLKEEKESGEELFEEDKEEDDILDYFLKNGEKELQELRKEEEENRKENVVSFSDEIELKKIELESLKENLKIMDKIKAALVQEVHKEESTEDFMGVEYEEIEEEYEEIKFEENNEDWFVEKPENVEGNELGFGFSKNDLMKIIRKETDNMKKELDIEEHEDIKEGGADEEEEVVADEIKFQKNVESSEFVSGFSKEEFMKVIRKKAENFKKKMNVKECEDIKEGGADEEEAEEKKEEVAADEIRDQTPKEDMIEEGKKEEEDEVIGSNNSDNEFDEIHSSSLESSLEEIESENLEEEEEENEANCLVKKMKVKQEGDKQRNFDVMITNPEKQFITLFNQKTVTTLSLDPMTPITFKSSLNLVNIDFISRTIFQIEDDYDFNMVRISPCRSFIAIHNTKNSIKIFELEEKQLTLHSTGELDTAEIKKTGFDIGDIYGIEDQKSDQTNHGIVEIHFLDSNTLVVFTIDKIWHIFKLTRKKNKKNFKYRNSGYIPNMNSNCPKTKKSKKMKKRDYVKFYEEVNKLTITGCSSSKKLTRNKKQMIMLSAISVNDEKIQSYLYLFTSKWRPNKKKKRKEFKLIFEARLALNDPQIKEDDSSPPIVLKNIFYQDSCYCLTWEKSKILKLKIDLNENNSEDKMKAVNWICSTGMNSAVNIVMSDKVVKVSEEDNDSFVLKGSISSEEIDNKIFYVFDCEGNILKIDTQIQNAKSQNELEETVFKYLTESIQSKEATEEESE